MGAVDLARVATRSFDWGVIKWMVSPGVGEQMVDDKPPFEVRCGDTILYPHSNLSGDRQHGLGAAAPVGALQSRRRRTGAGRSA
jgi:hypothetical protein